MCSHCCRWHLYYTTWGGRFTTVINYEQNTSYIHPHTLHLFLSRSLFSIRTHWVASSLHKYTQREHAHSYINGKKGALYSHTRTSVLISVKRKHTHIHTLCNRSLAATKLSDWQVNVRACVEAKFKLSVFDLFCWQGVFGGCVFVLCCVCGPSVWGSQHDVCLLTK